MLKAVTSALSIAREDWDRLANPQGSEFNPLVSHDFFRCVEESACAVAQTGWSPRHLVMEDADRITGIVPWVVLAFHVLAIGGTSDAKAPGFVYGIVVTIFILFNSFALVQFLQYKKIGKWADYLRGERTYITLSLVAKSLLAWQIFANTLIPT